MLVWRGLSVVVGIIWAILGIILIVVQTKALDGPTCSEALSSGQFYSECYDGSSGARIVSAFFAYPAGLLGVATLVASIYFAATGRGNRRLIMIGGAALALALMLTLWNNVLT